MPRYVWILTPPVSRSPSPPIGPLQAVARVSMEEASLWAAVDSAVRTVANVDPLEGLYGRMGRLRCVWVWRAGGGALPLTRSISGWWFRR